MRPLKTEPLEKVYRVTIAPLRQSVPKQKEPNEIEKTLKPREFSCYKLCLCIKMCSLKYP